MHFLFAIAAIATSYAIIFSSAPKKRSLYDQIPAVILMLMLICLKQRIFFFPLAFAFVYFSFAFVHGLSFVFDDKNLLSIHLLPLFVSIIVSTNVRLSARTICHRPSVTELLGSPGLVPCWSNGFVHAHLQPLHVPVNGISTRYLPFYYLCEGNRKNV